MLFDYDPTSAESILRYAKNLEGKTFFDVKQRYLTYYNRLNELDSNSNNNTAAKGQLGNFLEEYYFGYKPNSNQEADFPDAGVELKQTCIDVKKSGEYVAGERLSITNISYEEPVEIDFYKSHVWNKIRLILLIFYLRDKSIPRMFNKILFANLFTPPKDDLSIIISDYNNIIKKIRLGKAHEISESDTLYLGACTKGATAEKSLRSQYYDCNGVNYPAKKRNFCFKRSYMDYVLHAYILNDSVPYETIIKDSSLLAQKSFEDIIIERLQFHIGESDMHLCEYYNRIYNNNKAQWVDLTYRMLGIKGNHADEFVKSNIVVKTIRLEENNKIRENMSFPPFKFMNIINEDWEDSDIYNYFSSTKFLFVIFKRKKNHYILYDVKFWNMPISDLEGDVKSGWLKIKNTIINGITFKINKNGKVSNNLPGKNDNRIIHIRPHAGKSAYKLNNGYSKGDIEKDANVLPDGQYMTTQSFWINNNYILNEISK